MGLRSVFDVIDDLGLPGEIGEHGIVPDYGPGCEIFCSEFKTISKDLAPVDTGYLRNSLDADYFDTTITAITNCEYAQYQEYGTWCMAAQPYFEPALMQALMIASTEWERAIQEAQQEDQMLTQWEQEEEEMMAELEEAGSGMMNSIGGAAVGLGLGIMGGLMGAMFSDFSEPTNPNIQAAGDFGEAVGNYAMASAYASGASWGAGLAVGCLVGALTFFLTAPLAEAFDVTGYDRAQEKIKSGAADSGEEFFNITHFEIPEIEIF